MQQARLIAATACLALSLCPLGAQAPTPEITIKALDRWLAAYRAGSIAISRRHDIRESSIAVAMGLWPEASSRVTPIGELEQLVAHAVELDDGPAAQRLLSIAAIGLDRRRYSQRAMPTQVRLIGERGLWQLESTAARAVILEVARVGGTPDEPPGTAVAHQAAALRALGNYRVPVFRPALEQQLGSRKTQLRLAAAEGLLRMRALASFVPLVDALEQEREEPVIQTLAAALSDLLVHHRNSIWPPRVQHASRIAADALGRSTWRADLALVALLEASRQPAAVPALITVLEEFVDRRHAAQQSTRLQHRAFEALVALTGARHPIDEPAAWRREWKRVSPGRELPAELHPAKPAPGPRFFGLPIQGSHIVFLVDLSGSMDFPFHGRTTRLDVARDALVDAVRALPETTTFDIFTFSTRTTTWNGRMTNATRANKRRAADFIRAMEANGGTNTWGALSAALRLHGRAYGKPCGIEIDEMFLLSDGIPTTGSVIDAQAILRLVAEDNGFDNVRIHTVSLARELTARDQDEESKIGMRARDFMEQLARQNGGRFTEQF